VSRECSIEGCHRRRRTRGYCDMHYQRHRRLGDATAQVRSKSPNGTLRKWLVSHIHYTNQECLIWPFGRTRRGYGQITINGKHIMPHRLMCQLTHGDPEFHDAQARHLCGNGHLGCVNPKHLVWGTASENQLDRRVHGTDLLGSRNPSAKLTEADVIRIAAKRDVAGRILAEAYGVSRQQIDSIRNGRKWAHITGIGRE
jgi:hypothetical protein